MFMFIVGIFNLNIKLHVKSNYWPGLEINFLPEKHNINNKVVCFILFISHCN